jgi:hypothetical protein
MLYGLYRRYGTGLLVCIKYGLFLELSLKRNGCGLLDLTISGKNYPLKLGIKNYRRKSSPLPCSLIKQRKKDQIRVDHNHTGHNNYKIFLVQSQMPPAIDRYCTI